MKEKELQKQVVSFLDSLGCTWHVKYWGGGKFTRAGIPDLLCCIKGKFYAIELKSDIGIISDKQDETIIKIRQAGGYAFVLRPKNFEEFKRGVLDEIAG